MKENININFENIQNKEEFFNKLNELLEQKYFSDWTEEPELY